MYVNFVPLTSVDINYIYRTYYNGGFGFECEWSGDTESSFDFLFNSGVPTTTNRLAVNLILFAIAALAILAAPALATLAAETLAATTVALAALAWAALTALALAILEALATAPLAASAVRELWV